MDFSAFLGPPMGKEKPGLKLKPVEDEADDAAPLMRLHKDSVVEVEKELPLVRVGREAAAGRSGEGGPGERRIRSSEPDIGALIERNEVLLEEEWEADGPGRRVPWGWIALIGSAFAGGVLWSLVQVNQSEKSEAEVWSGTRDIIEREEQEDAAAADLIGSIENVARNFYGSRSVEELLQHVRHPERVRPLMEDYYRGHAPQPARLLRISSLDPLTIENRGNFWVVTSEVSQSGMDSLLVEADPGGSAKVDWETFVTHQPMNWDEFALERRGGFTADFRVYAAPDHFFSHEFADSEEFDCYRLTALGNEEILFGYVDRGSGMGERMRELMARGEGGAVPVILRLHVPEEAKSRSGVLILEVVNTRWIFLDPPGKGL